MSREAPSGESTAIDKAIRGWLGACDSGHTCVRPSETLLGNSPNPTWVIDTHQKCIVRGAEADRYLALSYVWPENAGCTQQTEPQHLQLDRARLLHFQTSQSLQNASSPLPKVIQDAIELTGMVGERYLWVDRFCIVQDGDDAASEVLRMDQIYSNAYLTIIAAGTDGLSLQPIPSHLDTQRLHGQTPQQTARRLVNAQIRQHYKKLSGSKWATRGWTYQEQILSRRSVIFFDAEVFWECDHSVWDDRLLRPDNDGAPTQEAAEMGRRLLQTTWPDFSLYVDLVCLYNHRSFSYQQDALAAISGILNVLAPVFPGEFISGLPSMFLDHALLWQPFFKATRRSQRPKSPDASPSDIKLPSWSWCGWQCLVDPWSLRSGLSYINTAKHQEISGAWRTRNLVTWSLTTSSEAETAILEPLKLDEQVEKTSCDRSDDVPTGWSRHIVADANLSNKSTTAFTWSGDRKASFKHPIPMGDCSSSRNLNNAARWLLCTTQRIFLRPAAVMKAKSSGIVLGAPKVSAYEHPLFQNLPPDQAPPVMILQDMHGRRSGLLRLMRDEDYDSLGQIELIAISKGSCSVQEMVGCYEQSAFNGRIQMEGTCSLLFFELAWLHKSLRPEGEPGGESRPLALPPSILKGHVTYMNNDTVHFYNVLWIERRDGIAYRRACGRILSPIWEQNVRETTEVRLG